METVLSLIRNPEKGAALAALLRKGGYHCVSALHDAEIARALSNDPGLAITDESALLEGSATRGWLYAPAGGRVMPVLLLVSEDVLTERLILDDADDFIIEPYGGDELLWRVRRIMARTARRHKRDSVLSAGDLTIDEQSFEVKVGKRVIDLTFREFQILKFLAERPNRVVTRDMLLAKVWGLDYFGGSRTIDVHIRRLRAKIEDADHTFIETVRNVGYRLKPATRNISLT